MATELRIVKKTNGISVYKALGNWYLEVFGKVYQYAEIVNGQVEQVVIFRVEENVKYGFLYNKLTDEVGDVFVYNTLSNKPLFAFK